MTRAPAAIEASGCSILVMILLRARGRR